DLGAELPQVQVAGRRIGPGVRHRDEWLLQIGVVEPGRLQHRARRGTRDSLLYCVAVPSHALIPRVPGPGRRARGDGGPDQAAATAGFLVSAARPFRPYQAM